VQAEATESVQFHICVWAHLTLEWVNIVHTYALTSGPGGPMGEQVLMHKTR